MTPAEPEPWLREILDRIVAPCAVWSEAGLLLHWNGAFASLAVNDVLSPRRGMILADFIACWSSHLPPGSPVATAVGAPDTPYATLGKLADGLDAQVAHLMLNDGRSLTVLLDGAEMAEARTRILARETTLADVVHRLPGLLFRRVRHADGRVSIPFFSRDLSASAAEARPSSFDDVRQIAALFAPEDFVEHLAAIEHSAMTLEPDFRDVKVRLPDGRPAWFRLLALPKAMPDGSVVWDGVSIDVTEHKLREQALAESEARYRILFEGVPAGVGIHQDGRFILANERLAALLGVPDARSLHGRATLEFIAPERRDAVAAGIAGSLLGGVSSGLQEEEIFRPDGTRLPVEYVALPTVDDGRPAMQVFVRDLSERKATQRMLAERETQLELIVANLPAAVYRRILHPDGRITYSSFSKNLIGATDEHRAEVLRDGRALLKVIVPEDRVRFVQAMRRSASELSPFNEVVRTRIDDGPDRWVQSMGNPQRLDDGAVAWDGLVIEITQQKQQEIALAESEARYRKLIEKAPLGIGIVQDGVFVYANPKLAQILGADDAAAIVGYSIAIVDPGPRATAARLDLADGVSSEPRECRLVRLDGDFTEAEVIVLGTRERDRPAVKIFVRDLTRERAAERALGEREDTLRSVLDNLPLVLYRRVLGVDGVLRTEFNKERADEILAEGLPSDASGIERFLAMIHPGDRNSWLSAVARSAADLSPFRIDYRARLRDGTEQWMRSAATPYRRPDGAIVWDGLALDITEMKQQEAATVESEDRYRQLVEAAPVAIVVHCDWRIVFANARMADLGGYASSEELIGIPVLDLVHPDGRDLARSRVEYLYRSVGRLDSVRGRWQRRDGTLFEIESSAIALSIRGAIHVQATVNDITDRLKAEERMQRLAMQDALTGLPNRTVLMDRLRLGLADARRRRCLIAVMLLDLDGFKDVNDTLGHTVGDQLLRLVGERVGALLRKSDTLARLGGDEFAIVQTDVATAESAAALAQKVIDRVALPYLVEGQIVHTAASIGITLAPHDSDDAEALIRNADMALYRAKGEGRARYSFFEPAMQTAMLARRRLEGDLRRAMDLCDEFRLVYQPQRELSGNTVSGVEALLRWQHPERGFLPPDEFIPVAEATGIIRPLGEWVLAVACRQAREWELAGFPLTMAVNVSPAQLRQQDLAATVARVLEETGLAPGLLVLEITESLLLDTGNEVMATLQRLADSGVEIAIDDLGTGYSSLSHLKRFPVRRIKIDKSFVLGIGSDPESEAIVRAILALGRSLGKSIVAEGVETVRQLDFLRELGCDSVQGYLLGRPMAPQAIEELLGIATGGRRPRGTVTVTSH